MIQDISPLKLDNHYSPDVKPEQDSIIFHFRNNDVLCQENSEKLFPLYENFTIPDNLIYLFSISERKYFLLRDSVIVIPENFDYADVKKLRHNNSIDRTDIFALATAYHLSQWYNNNRFCGKCGGITTDDRSERALECTFCGKIIYPRINPAVIVGVTDGNRLLITRYAANRGVNCDALIAGFTEAGETLEETVNREVMEEVGLKVKNIHYYKSQPWGYSGCILAGFYCEADGNTNIILDKSELSTAEWVERENITGQPDDLSLTNEMMINFKNNQYSNS